MAGIKISALTAAPNALLTDIFPAVQAGVTVKESLQQVLTLFNANIQLASISQVTGLSAALAGFLPLSGGTMSGPLILFTNSPSTALEAASKGYVDTVASGFTVILACSVATTANLTVTYANGAAGVGATLTNAGVQLALVIDGVALAVNDRVLVKNQTTTFQNGIYQVTNIGSGATNWILTRTTDYDQAPSEIHPGTLVAINQGTANTATSWLETATVATIGTDPILFSQFSFAPTDFLKVVNNLSDVANAATSRTNLGLGTVATKTASDNTKTIAAMVNGATTIGNLAVFSDITGTIEDGGPPAGAQLNFAASGRVTLTSGQPVTTADVLAATTIFFTPFKGNQVPLFDGVSTWTNFTFTELSIAVPGTANTMYDLFIFDNVGTPTLETQPWTNDTARAVGIVLQDGVYVKSGATTRRFLSSFRTTNVAGQTEDSRLKRYVWNYYNRVARPLIRQEATPSWNYSVAAWRQANNSVLNQIDFVCGVAEDEITATVVSIVISNTTTVRNTGTNIGVDSTTVPSATLLSSKECASDRSNNSTAFYKNTFLGRHFLTWMEFGAGADVQTWIGAKNTATFSQSGIVGTILG